jgi:hypothetical protein
MENQKIVQIAKARKVKQLERAIAEQRSWCNDNLADLLSDELELEEI